MKQKNENGLTDKEQRFADLYLIEPNATKAHKDAGYSAKSDASHRAGASELLTNPNIKAYFDKKRAEIANKLNLKQEDVLRELMSLAFSRITDYGSFGENGFVMLDSNTIDKLKIGAIQSIKTTVTTIRGKENEPETIKTMTEFKLWDKPTPLIKLGEHLGIFKSGISLEDFESILVTIRK